MFSRPHHQAILKALGELDADLLMRAECWFGGGTAIVLMLDEYRESVDIDFLCPSQAGYRLLRQSTFGAGLAGLLRPGADIEEIRELRADQIGFRAIVGCLGSNIKFEILREARIDVSGSFDPALGVPVLSREDMYAERLLANADRWRDTSTLSRDIIDLSMMISH